MLAKGALSDSDAVAQRAGPVPHSVRFCWAVWAVSSVLGWLLIMLAVTVALD